LGYYGDYKQLKKGLYELRLCFGSGYRIYFTEEMGKIIILLLGGDKTTQARDIKKAEKYLALLKTGRK
jgi:putative addiction module killer protein